MAEFVASGMTDIGNERDTNEDFMSLDSDVGLYVVCDGMGGHAAGDVASRMAVQLVSESVQSHRDEIREARARPGGYFQLLEMVESAVQKVSSRLFELASSKPECAGMGTTLTLLLIIDDKALMVHVGDSRLYLMRQRELHLLSNDHTLARELQRRTGDGSPSGKIEEFSHILTRAIGSHEGVETDSLLFDLLPGDTCLLCSDGLSNYFNNETEVCDILQKNDLKSIPTELVRMAKERGGKDNITAIVVRVLSTDAQSRDEADQPFDVRGRFDGLRSIEFFSELSYGRLMRVVQVTKLKSCTAGNTFLAEGDECEGLYVLLDGRLSVTRDGEPQKELSAGNFFGETALTIPRPAFATVTAAQPSHVLVVRRDEFRRLTRRFPKLGSALLSKLSGYLGRRLDQTDPAI